MGHNRLPEGTTMKETASTDYRSRTCGTYVTARGQALAPDNIVGRRLRLPDSQRVIQRYLPSGGKAASLELDCGS